MPIAVKDFEWEQTEKMLFITVPLKGVAKNKVDILSTETYIKVRWLTGHAPMSYHSASAFVAYEYVD